GSEHASWHYVSGGRNQSQSGVAIAGQERSRKVMAAERIDETVAKLRPASPAILAPGHTFASITDKISAVVLSRETPGAWLLAAGAAGALTLFLLFATGYQLARGIGIWGVNIPVAWGFAIVNFVWWIGIGHAGTLISAILLLLKQKWRNSINRFAEAMTLFAVMCAGYY